MSEGEDFPQEERLQARLVALRRGLAQLPADAPERVRDVDHGTRRATPAQLRKSLQLFVDCSTSSKRSRSASRLSWTAGRTTLARKKVPLSVDRCERTGGWTLRPRLIRTTAATSGGDSAMPVPHRIVADKEFGRATRLPEDPDR